MEIPKAPTNAIQARTRWECSLRRFRWLGVAGLLIPLFGIYRWKNPFRLWNWQVTKKRILTQLKQGFQFLPEEPLAEALAFSCGWFRSTQTSMGSWYFLANEDQYRKISPAHNRYTHGCPRVQWPPKDWTQGQSLARQASLFSCLPSPWTRLGRRLWTFRCTFSGSPSYA